jgi:hypothetical protein
MTEWFEDDEGLALELTDALHRTRPLAEGIAARAKGAFTWRTIDEDLLTAKLMFDSAQQTGPPSTRSDPGSSRLLVFTANLRSVEIEVLPDRVMGQFIPPCGGQVEVEGDGGVITSTQVDDLGFFVVEPVPTGVVRLRCTTPTTRLVTDWVRL